MFQEYNASLRSRDKNTKYKTTIHLISSGLIKLSAIQPSVSLFRGVSGRSLPDRCGYLFTFKQDFHEIIFHCSFNEADKFNVKGGTELAFMSCSMDPDQALEYGKGGYDVILLACRRQPHLISLQVFV